MSVVDMLESSPFFQYSIVNIPKLDFCNLQLILWCQVTHCGPSGPKWIAEGNASVYLPIQVAEQQADAGKHQPWNLLRQLHEEGGVAAGAAVVPGQIPGIEASDLPGKWGRGGKRKLRVGW